VLLYHCHCYCRCSELFKQLHEEQQVPEAETSKPAEVETAVVAESPAKGKKTPPAPAKNT